MINRKDVIKSVKSMKSVNLMHVTQVIDENNRMKSWRQLAGEAG